MIKKMLNLFKLKSKREPQRVLKKYKGKFLSGKAEYTYLDNPGVGRIYEGKFRFSGSIENGISRGKVDGMFCNNRKEGTWTYRRNHNICLKMNYSQGVPEGSYELISQSTQYPESLSFAVSNHRFLGEIAGSDISFVWMEEGEISEYYTRIRLKGQFDEEGYCHGEWLFEDMFNLNIFHATFEHGICQGFTRENLTTGDFSPGSAQVQESIFGIIKENYTRMEKMVDRNCVEWSLREVVKGAVF